MPASKEAENKFLLSLPPPSNHWPS